MGLSEILLIMVIAFILFGPEDLPNIARKVAKLYFQIRKATNELTKEFQNVIDSQVNTFNKAFAQTNSSHALEKVAPVVAEKSKNKEQFLKYEDEILTPESSEKVDDPR